MADTFDLTIDDFLNIDIGQHIGDYKGYSGLCTNLNIASKECADSDSNKAKLLKLLASITSMSIHGGSLHEPLVPACRWADGTCSAHVDCFTTDELMFLETIVPEVNDVFLIARIRDLLWIRSETKNIQHARGAIDAYHQFPLTADTCFENQNAWERGIRLAQQIGKGAEGRILGFRTDLLNLLEAACAGENRYAFDLSELLQVCGVEPKQVQVILDKLEFFIAAVEKEDDSSWVRGFCEQAMLWHAKANAEEEICTLKVKIAESWVSDAETHGSEMASGSHYTSAIEVYQSIKREFRDQFGVEDKLKELHQKRTESNRHSLDEMKEIRSEGIDISESIEWSQQCVAGKPPEEALRVFANLHPISDFEKMKEQAKEEIKRFPLQAIFSANHMGSGGRVIAKTPGVNFASGDEDANAPMIRQKMMESKMQHIGLVVQGVIFPALRVINQEHRITERDLLFLCQNSSVAPRDRAGLWAKGLYYGFDQKFLESTHILPFQIEHWIRMELKSRHHKTTVLKDGVDTEKGLSTLLDDAHISEVMDENLLFELQAVLTDPLGPNFRNNVAHGLVGENIGLTVHSMYLWWLCFKLVINNVAWKTQPKEDEGKDVEGQVADAAAR